MDSELMQLDGELISPMGTPIEVIRARLEALPLFTRYADQVDAVLILMRDIRPWLATDDGPALAYAAFQYNDAISQFVEGNSARTLARQVQHFSKTTAVDDAQAIMAFAMGCSLRALDALASALDGDPESEIADLEMFALHLDTIAQHVPQAAVALEASSAAMTACDEIGDRALDAARRTIAKIDGIRSGIARRGVDGTAHRDMAIWAKALELVHTGTHFRNLNSKLRNWQRREIEALQRKQAQDGQPVDQLKPLSKPAMAALLKRFGLSLEEPAVNQEFTKAKK